MIKWGGGFWARTEWQGLLKDGVVDCGGKSVHHSCQPKTWFWVGDCLSPNLSRISAVPYYQHHLPLITIFDDCVGKPKCSDGTTSKIDEFAVEINTYPTLHKSVWTCTRLQGTWLLYQWLLNWATSALVTVYKNPLGVVVLSRTLASASCISDTSGQMEYSSFGGFGRRVNFRALRKLLEGERG
jgi:hypothetical protein